MHFLTIKKAFFAVLPPFLLLPLRTISCQNMASINFTKFSQQKNAKKKKKGQGSLERETEPTVLNRRREPRQVNGSVGYRRRKGG